MKTKHPGSSFPFQQEVERRFSKITNIFPLDDDIKEALMEIMGDTYFEMRKLECTLKTHVEEMIIKNKYAGYNKGKKLTDAEIEQIKQGERMPEELKDFVQQTLRNSWNSMNKKQRLGMEKLFIYLSTTIKYKDGDEANTIHSGGN